MHHEKINSLDRAGIFVSFLCAIHCALLPLLLSLLPLAGLVFFQNCWIELTIIGTSVLIAGVSLIRSFLHHHKVWPLIVVGLGFLLLYTGHQPAVSLKWLWLSIGGLTIAMAHLLNWRFDRAGEH